MPKVCNTLPSSVHWRTVWSPSSVSQIVSSGAMNTPCGRTNTPSPQVRNRLPSRSKTHIGCPDVLTFARIAHEAGADGLTVHPRPDERHIRRSDVPALAGLMQPWRPQCELNIEGYPDDRLFEIVREVRPEQCTLVPDPP